MSSQFQNSNGNANASASASDPAGQLQGGGPTHNGAVSSPPSSSVGRSSAATAAVTATGGAGSGPGPSPLLRRGESTPALHSTSPDPNQHSPPIRPSGRIKSGASAKSHTSTGSGNNNNNNNNNNNIPQATTIPELFLCPITLELMTEPTSTRCGHLFDRTAIVKWMKGEYDATRGPANAAFARSCPVCHQRIDEDSLAPCYPVKQAIVEWIKDREREATLAETTAGGGGGGKSVSPGGGDSESGKSGNNVMSLIRGKLRLGKKSGSTNKLSSSSTGNLSSSASSDHVDRHSGAAPARQPLATVVHTNASATSGLQQQQQQQQQGVTVVVTGTSTGNLASQPSNSAVATSSFNGSAPGSTTSNQYHHHQQQAQQQQQQQQQHQSSSSGNNYNTNQTSSSISVGFSSSIQQHPSQQTQFQQPQQQQQQQQFQQPLQQQSVFTANPLSNTTGPSLAHHQLPHLVAGPQHPPQNQNSSPPGTLHYYAQYMSHQRNQQQAASQNMATGTSGYGHTGSIVSMSGAGVTQQISTTASAELDSPLVAEWARLVPLLPHIHPAISLNREKFVLGRHVSCHGRLNLSEISSRHAYLWRTRRESDGLWEVLIEDRSTNGTFVNGRTVGKGHRRVMRAGDEVAFGRKFTSKREVPDVTSFLDWVFVGTVQATDHRGEIERAKQIASFQVLVTMSDGELAAFGVHSESVRQTILAAVANWKHEHRFPAYRLELVDPHLYAAAGEPPAPASAVSAQHTMERGSGATSGTGVGPAHSSSTLGPLSVLSQQTATIPRPSLSAGGEPGVPTVREEATSAQAGAAASMVQQLTLLDQVITRLAAQFPRADAETISVVAKYERLVAGRVLGLDEWEMRAALKLADITGKPPVIPSTTPFGLAPQQQQPAVAPVAAPPAFPVFPSLSLSRGIPHQQPQVTQPQPPPAHAQHSNNQQQLAAQLAMAQMAMLAPMMAQNPTLAQSLWQAMLTASSAGQAPLAPAAPVLGQQPPSQPQVATSAVAPADHVSHVDVSSSTAPPAPPVIPSQQQHALHHPQPQLAATTAALLHQLAALNLTTGPMATSMASAPAPGPSGVVTPPASVGVPSSMTPPSYPQGSVTGEQQPSTSSGAGDAGNEGEVSASKE